MKQILFSFFLSILSLTCLSQSTVVDVIVNSPEHNTLEAAVIAAELADDLSGPGPFTVFAPTDAAFAALPAGVVDALLLDPTGDLAQILLYHVVSGTALSTSLTDGQIINTLQGDDITVTITDNGVMINNAMVTAADITADNGVVHVISAVLLPPAPQPTNTILDIVVNSADHDTLEAAVIAAGLAETLSGDGPYTVFAPTDAAFATLPAGTIEALLANTGELMNILLYHAASGTVLSTDLTNGQTIPTLTFYPPLVVTIDANGVFINNAMVTVADIVADNGVVHVIDAVLLPPSPQPTTVVDVIVNSDSHNTLEAAVIAAGLAETLSGDGPFTVFAPTDDAFAALPAGTIETLLSDPTGILTQILLYHVSPGLVLSTDLTNGQTLPTLTSFPPMTDMPTLLVTINDNGVMINNAMVTVADIVTDNGVVHVIDAVLLQQPTSVSQNETFEFTFQNPVNQFINIPNSSNVNVEVVSLNGQVVFNQNFNSTVNINTDNFSNGIYVLKMQGNDFNHTCKFVK